MLQKIFIFLTAIIVFSCSSDDDNNSNNQEDPQNLILKKFTYKNVDFDNSSVLYFNTNGTLEKSLSLFSNITEDNAGYNIYEYNEQGNLIAKKIFNSDNEFIRNERVYMYNSQNILTSVIDYGDGENGPYTTSFSYSNNRIDYVEVETNKTGYILLDDLGRISKTGHTAGPSGIIEQELIYENNKVSEVRIPYQQGSYVFIYETDDNTNPLFDTLFFEKPLQYIILNHSLQDIDFTGIYSHLQGNITRETIHDTFYNNSYINREVSNTYNDSGYLVNATVSKFDETTEEFTFEYY
ncbi:hypothetical protein [Cochleicola gelatinilyticus]|nr:hypothetical protein [Cochleicola gelatinilyticus]